MYLLHNPLLDTSVALKKTERLNISLNECMYICTYVHMYVCKQTKTVYRIYLNVSRVFQRFFKAEKTTSQLIFG